MTPEAETRWMEANQKYLLSSLAEVKVLLERHAKGESSVESDRAAPVWTEEIRPSLDILCSNFGLSRFERRLLLLCAGVELDGNFASLCGRAHNDPARSYPTFSLALAALPEAHWSALTPTAPLRHWRMIEIGQPQAGPITTSPLRIDERILHFLAGIQYLDDRLVGLLKPVRLSDELVSSHAAVAGEIAATLRRERPAPVIGLCGGDELTRRSIAAAACAELGVHLLAMTADTIPQNIGELDGFLRLWEREAVLAPAALYVEAGSINSADPAVGLSTTRLLEHAGGICLLGVRDRWRPLRRTVLTFEVSKPTMQEQRAVWEAALGAANAQANGHLPALISQFSLNIGTIRSSVRAALATSEGGTLGDRLWNAARREARPALEDLAHHIRPVANWNDLVLPEAELAQLRDIATHVAQRHKLYEEWGFGSRSSRGLGISALFAGASGTGKTMAAEVLANYLKLDLYRIDLSCVVSKYIGETEKNLRRVFDAAEDGGVILFFDEADALFGKRSEVKDSHDRYANIEINYLLQRMESYRGLAVLATNMKSALDQAFLRRIRFVVNFPFPDIVLRAEIWRRAFPKATPVEGLDIARLARLDLAGGNIRNIAMNAAFLASATGDAVRMEQIRHAAKSEFAKLDKPIGDSGGFL
jgi:hypothetical protein